MTNEAYPMPESTTEMVHAERVSSANPSWLAKTIVCPACLAPGVLQNTRTEGDDRFCECPRCHRFYPIDAHGVVDFQPPDKLLALPEGALEMWAIAQRRGAEEYRSRSPGSMASPERGAARAFGRFIDVAGKTVLDVGSGTDYFPAYMHGQAAAQYVALDPLPVERATPFTKVQAWAELMPFASASFDVLLCGTSLDHVVCLESALSDMSRVLRPGGTLCLWTALYADPKWFANLMPAPCFAREEEGAEERSLETDRRDRDRLAERIGNVDAMEQQYGHLLVDQWHFRHLPVSFVKQFADYGFALRDLEVWEHNFHEGAIFLNAFLALENRGALDARASQIDHQLGVWAMLAGLTERLSNERQEIAVIRDVVASGHRHTELAREELRALAAKVGDVDVRVDTEISTALREREAERQSVSQMLQEQHAMVAKLVDQQARAMEQLPALAERLDAVREEQTSQAQAIDRLSREQAKVAPVLASMHDQVRQLWRAAGVARFLSWLRGPSA
jgi:SAM-dependent methyltransferase